MRILISQWTHGAEEVVSHVTNMGVLIQGVHSTWQAKFPPQEMPQLSELLTRDGEI